MELEIILLGVLISLATAAPNEERRGKLTTQSLVESHGYPFEEHSVQTSDGYILTMHRIPYSGRVESSSEDKQRPVAFLMHGILCSSSDWVLLGPDKALAYLLSDAGYDVWLGNARGNTYSRQHATLNPLFRSFWNFGWHEIGLYDIPAMIDYIRFYTDEDQVTYIGHSQATTAFFLLNSLNERFKARIKSAHLLAPIVFMENMESPMMPPLSLLVGITKVPELFGNLEFMPSNALMRMMGQASCSDSSPFQIICSNVLFLIAGHDSENLNTTLLPEIMATTPAGCSVNQGFHYLQVYTSKEFRQYDYGMIRNKLIYGKTEPPKYPLEKVDVPIYMYYGQNDNMASVVDVHRLIRSLPESTVKRAYQVPHEKWNHLDFLWGLNIKEQVYNALLEDVQAAQLDNN